MEDRVPLLERLWNILLNQGILSTPPWHKEVVTARIPKADAERSNAIPLEQLRKELLGEPGLQKPSE